MIINIIYINLCNNELNLSCQSLQQGLCGNLCTWAQDIRLHIAGINEPKIVQ